jgi:hypothetical protein
LLAVFYFIAGVVAAVFVHQGFTVTKCGKQHLRHIRKLSTGPLIVISWSCCLLQNKVKFMNNDILLYCGDGSKNYCFCNAVYTDLLLITVSVLVTSFVSLVVVLQQQCGCLVSC